MTKINCVTNGISMPVRMFFSPRKAKLVPDNSIFVKHDIKDHKKTVAKSLVEKQQNTKG